MKNSEIRKCVVCGKPFKFVKVSWYERTTCSQKCAKTRTGPPVGTVIKTVECEVCEKEFTFTWRQGSHKRTTCSKKCQYELAGSKRLGKPRYHTKPQVKRAPLPDPIRGARWIPLTEEKFALVDIDIFEEVSRYNWHFGSGGYARRGRAPGILMHRYIMNATRGEEIDHVNGNKLDNRRKNLRKTDDQGNNRNRKKFKGAYTSRYKGVSWFKPDPAHSLPGRWLARILVEGQKKYLGKFVHEEDAARAYDKAARKYFGEFATLNFPDVSEQSTQHGHTSSKSIT